MSKLDPRAVAFFYEHAGPSYNPTSESPEEGRMRTALDLAQAESWAERKGIECEWVEDWEVLDHVREYDGYDHEPETCEVAVLKSRKGHVLASLGCIDDATDDYRRVVQAELALEAMPA